jgi:hypothetical protein
MARLAGNPVTSLPVYYHPAKRHESRAASDQNRAQYCLLLACLLLGSTACVIGSKTGSKYVIGEVLDYPHWVHDLHSTKFFQHAHFKVKRVLNVLNGRAIFQEGMSRREAIA